MKGWNNEEMRERINRIILMEGLSRAKFASKVGIAASNFNEVLLGKRGVPQSLPSKIVSAYPEIRIDWLLYGEGEMYASEQKAVEGEEWREERDSMTVNTKPRLPVSAAAGRLSAYVGGVKRYECDEMPVIRSLPSYDFTMFIKGNSMEPKYESGDEIALKKATIIEWGKDYVLDTDDGPIFKKIYEDGENIRCVSYNHDEYPDFMVPKNAIYGYYRFVGLIRV